MRVAVRRGRTRTIGARIRGWSIESAQILHDHEARMLTAEFLWRKIEPFNADLIVGIEAAGGPLILALAQAALDDRYSERLSTINFRSSGTHVDPACARRIEAGDRVVLIDDVLNSGRTARSVIRVIESKGAIAAGLICLVKYTNGRPLALRKWRGTIDCVFTLDQLGLHRFLPEI
nr:phosphoribosyltransferase family protein [Mycolicibacterium sphagni]